MLSISKKDIFWSYFAHIFITGSGLITLPLILKLLTPDEIGMNYLMLSLGALVSLFDFGFTPQFSRNITYVFSGAQELKKEGVIISDFNNVVNYKLLSMMIKTAEFVYRRLALIVLAVLITLGTCYIFYITNGFINIKNSLAIWLIFSLGICFNIYYSFYNSLLLGSGQIMQSKKALFYSRIFYVMLTFVLLYCRVGLMGVVIANLVSPFVNRIISHKYFFTKELNDKLKVHTISKDEKLELFKIIWYNSKKLGLVFVGSYAVNKLSIFLAGLYLSLTDIASYGLMMQFFGIITMLSGMFFNVFEPRFSSLRSKGDRIQLTKEFAFTMCIYYLFFIIGTVSLILTLPSFLNILNTSTNAPPIFVMLVYALVLFLEGNHSCFASLIVTENKVPFVKSSLIAGFFIGLFDYIVLKYTELGILGMIMVQGIIQLSYANWKWPKVILVQNNISFIIFLKIGITECYNRINISKKIIN